MGVDGQDGQELARAQADTEVNQPDQAIGKGRWLRGKPQTRGPLDADD